MGSVRFGPSGAEDLDLGGERVSTSTPPALVRASFICSDFSGLIATHRRLDLGGKRGAPWAVRRTVGGDSPDAPAGVMIFCEQWS